MTYPSVQVHYFTPDCPLRRFSKPASHCDGIWGEGTVDELANYIKNKMPDIGGFNRRGLYRMK